MGTNSDENSYMSFILKYLLEHIRIHLGIIKKVNYYSFNDMQSKDVKNILEYLKGLFKAIETYIEKHQNDISITLDFENEIREFAQNIGSILLVFFEKLKEYQQYKDLLIQRHIAYNVYHILNTQNVGIRKIERDKQLLGQVYAGLASFYEHFHGHFKDNEEAIELLCKYYPEILPESLKEEKLAKILYPHVLLAGTPGDVGYSYHGIRMIQQYIGNLSQRVIYHLLAQYRLSDIVYKDVCRHQIVTIIWHSCLNETEKINLKFQYVDFLVLVGQTHHMIDKMLSEKYGIDENIYLGIHGEFVNNRLVLNQKTSVYWERTSMGTNQLFVKKIPYLQISLKKKENELYGIRIRKIRSSKEVNFPFFKDSWLLDYLLSKDTQEVLDRLDESYENTIAYKQMFFSLLYLNQYRGIKEREIDFEHDYFYDSKIREVKKKDLPEKKIPHFYGEKVHSLSCIVGKNGTGKTSIVDFLRETFFRLIKLIQMGILECENGYVREENYQEFQVLDKGAEFLVVFKLDEEAYFLTNIQEVTVTELKPFSGEVYFNDNEFSKIVYFSNMLKSNQKYLYEDTFKLRKENKENEGQALAESLEDFRQIDYSESDSFIRRRRGLEADKNIISHTVNRDLCYQFTFLKNTPKEKLQEYLDLEEQKVFYIKSDKLGDKSFTLTDLELENGKKQNKVKNLEKEYIYLSDAWISHFSSGQYAKFTFLSKLYWFLEGYVKEKEHYASFVDVNEFSMKEVLEKEDTALIFIDEGELFYHPEWQRRYISTLLEMVNKETINAKMQIVITTNSPFILSDVLKEDVTYLNKEQEMKAKYDSPLGQNIHKLLKDNFFMDYTIGEYGRKLIETLIDGMQTDKELINEKKEEKSLKDSLKKYFGEEIVEVDAVRKLIMQIGEIVYRQGLEELADEYFGLDNEREIQYMEEKIKQLQAQVEQKRAALKEEK